MVHDTTGFWTASCQLQVHGTTGSGVHPAAAIGAWNDYILDCTLLAASALYDWILNCILQLLGAWNDYIQNSILQLLGAWDDWILDMIMSS